MSFVQNRWYATAWLDELENGPIRRIALGQPLVIFKTEAGKVSALLDRCSHRAVPLSLGKVIGETIQCPYHGLQFNVEGTCVVNPHITGKPETQKVRRFPTQIRYGGVWVWFGSEEKASTTPLPAYELFERTNEFDLVRGSLHVRADYRLVIDNLLDLNHAEYLHANTVGTPGSAGNAESRLLSGDDWVTVERKIFNLAPSALYKPVWTKSERIDQQSNMTWRAPSYLLLDQIVTAPNGSNEEGFRFPSAHILTPETETSTHYFWMVGRNFLRDNPEMSARIRTMINTAFGEEDRPIIEAAQETLSLLKEDQRLSSFTIGDGGAMRVRRMLDDLAGAEQALAS